MFIAAKPLRLFNIITIIQEGSNSVFVNLNKNKLKNVLFRSKVFSSKKFLHNKEKVKLENFKNLNKSISKRFAA